MNLYQYHRLISQRARRAPRCLLSQKIKERSSAIFDPDCTHEDLLSHIAELQTLEAQLPRHLTRYGDRMEMAVLSGDYSARRPHPIRHRHEHPDKPGYIYILTAPSRPGECKLGVTSLAVRKRCQLYRSRYGYEVEEVFAQWTTSPFKLEALVQQKAVHIRVSGNTKGDSIEWYLAKPSTMKTYIRRALAELA